MDSQEVKKMIADEQLAEIENRLKRVTPGPWEMSIDPYKRLHLIRNKDTGVLICMIDMFVDRGRSFKDVFFFENAYADISWLVEQLKEKNECIAKLKEVLKEDRE
jgi:hypothetical protein